MKKFLVRVATLVVAMLLLAGCQLVAGTMPGVDTQADADVSAPDTGAGTDVSGGQDTQTDADTSTDVAGGDQDSGNMDGGDVAICPTPQRPQAVVETVDETTGQSWCLTPFEHKAYKLLAESKGVPQKSCLLFGDYDYCVVNFALAPPMFIGNVFSVTETWPGVVNPDAKLVFDFNSCDEKSGICTAKFDGSAGGDVYEATLNVNSKEYTMKRPSTTFPYRLISKDEEWP